MYSNPRKVYLHSAISTTSHLYLVVVILSLLGYYIHTNLTNCGSHSRSRNCEFLGFFFCTYSVFLLIYFMLKLRDLQPFFCFIYLDVFYLLSSKEKSYKKKALDFLSCWDFSFFFCVLREPLRSTDCFNGGRFKNSEIEQSEILEFNPHSNRYKQ